MELIAYHRDVARVRVGEAELFSLQPCDAGALKGFQPNRSGVFAVSELLGTDSGFTGLFFGKEEVQAVNVGAGAIFYFRKGVLLQQLDPNPLSVSGSYKPYFKQSLAKGDSVLLCDTGFLGAADPVRVQIERCQSSDPESWLDRLNPAGRACAVFIV